MLGKIKLCTSLVNMLVDFIEMWTLLHLNVLLGVCL